jgi:hypothetical protein
MVGGAFRDYADFKTHQGSLFTSAAFTGML